MTSSAPITFDDAAPVVAAFETTLPDALQNKTTDDRRRAWPEWVKKRDLEIRARLARGDEDSIVNLWMYGTSFTERPRATERTLASIRSIRNRDAVEELLLDRLDEFVEGLASPGTNERLQFARQVVGRQGLDPTTPEGQQRTRLYLVQLRERMIAETRQHQQTARSARQTDRASALPEYATIYKDRGLSSDSSIPAHFGLERAIEALASRRLLPPGSVGRVAIVGPGLDFTDKAEGFDFYPPQTVQPFAVVDSLSRHGLAAGRGVDVTTLDLSPRVNAHVTTARERSMKGGAYVLQLPLASDRTWRPELIEYWERLGDRIGSTVAPIPVPLAAGQVRLRAIAVRPEVVRSIEARDLNIVLERLEVSGGKAFDLIVATNVLVYYDAFEQALALANVAAMLRPGGYFLTNYIVFPQEPMERDASVRIDVFWDRDQNGDTLFGYQRRPG